MTAETIWSVETRENHTPMERESANLDREFKMAEQSNGTDHLDLVLAKGYVVLTREQAT
jgi:hypothetical protein